MEPTTNMQLTLNGNTFSEVVDKARALVDQYDSAPARTARTTTTTTRKTKPPVIEDSFLETEETETLEASDDTIGFDDAEETETETKAAKTTTKTAKVTDKDINNAAMAHAKKHGRPETLKILNKKFKVKSILELKPEQYGDVLKALKV